MKLCTVLLLFHQVQFPLGKPTSSHYKSVNNYERREMMLHTPQLASGDLAGALWGDRAAPPPRFTDEKVVASPMSI